MKQAIQVLILYAITSSTGAQSLAAEMKTLGVWNDLQTPLMSCYIHIEENAGKYEAVTRSCARGSERFEADRTPLKKTGKNSFRPADSRLGDWFYLISASGELEVRDRKGVIRSIPSTAPRTADQRRAKLKGDGVSIGMQKDEVLASSWGKPQKINRTRTASGIREQWVYRGGFLYFERDTLVAIQN
jgi:hypothetical protein